MAVGKPHDEAVKEALQANDWRRSYVEGLLPEKIDWGYITPIAEVNTDEP